MILHYIVVQSKYCKYICFPLMGGHENKSVYLVSDVDSVSSVNHAHTELRQELFDMKRSN